MEINKVSAYSQDFPENDGALPQAEQKQPNSIIEEAREDGLFDTDEQAEAILANLNVSKSLNKRLQKLNSNTNEIMELFFKARLPGLKLNRAYSIQELREFIDAKTKRFVDYIKSLSPEDIKSAKEE